MKRMGEKTTRTFRAHTLETAVILSPSVPCQLTTQQRDEAPPGHCTTTLAGGHRASQTAAPWHRRTATESQGTHPLFPVTMVMTSSEPQIENAGAHRNPNEDLTSVYNNNKKRATDWTVSRAVSRKTFNFSCFFMTHKKSKRSRLSP